VSTLAAKLAQARAEARAMTAREAGGAVASVTDAYRVQDALAATHGAVRAWKVSALVPEQQRGYPTDRPVGGALFVPFCHDTPARLALKSFVAPLMECEIAFKLGRDLPMRAASYTRAEIAEAIEAMVPAIEIADCRWSADATDLQKLADNMGNGAFIAGAAVRDWRSVDLGGREVVLTLNGTDVARGPCAKVLGDPLMGVVGLANAQPLPAGGLKRGQIVTTGTCITPIAMKAGAYVADFGALGRVELTVG
ncbi:MAG: 2-keto-4-pentenoate hydratase, partial [Pseudolabrys sp.]